MMPRQLPVHLPCHPFTGFMVLACRAMTVAARTEDNMLFSTLFTLVVKETMRLSSTGQDGIQSLMMVKRHLRSKPVQIFRRKCSEYFSDFIHVPVLSLSD